MEVRTGVRVKMFIRTQVGTRVRTLRAHRRSHFPVGTPASGQMRFLRFRRRADAPPDQPAPKPKAWLDSEEEWLTPPRDLWINPDDSITHYVRWIWEYLAYLTILCGLQRHDAVLELGCGHGRIARGLLTYMRSPGRYVGLDVDARRIGDASERFTSRYPNFTFIRADIHSLQYNPTGAIGASDYTFPFDDDAFDVIFAASLFTHLLPSEAANYFRECARVLRRDGRCLVSVFVLDYYRGPGTTISTLYEFPHQFPGYEGAAVRHLDHPDAAIAYSLRTLQTMSEAAGLRIERVLPGLWAEGQGWACHEQDLLLLAHGTGSSWRPVVGCPRPSETQENIPLSPTCVRRRARARGHEDPAASP